MTDPAPLDYAPGARRRLQRRTIQRLLIVLTVAAVAVVAWRSYSAVAARVELLLLERRLLNYDPPEGQAAYELLPPNEAATRPVTPDNLLTPGEIRPLSADWQAYLFGRDRHVPVFVHGRTNKNGTRLVSLVINGGRGTQMLFLDAQVIKPTELFSWPALTRTNIGLLCLPVRPTDHIVIQSGRADPQDERRFSLVISVDGSDCIIDGRLLDDDSLHLKPRTGRRRYSTAGMEGWEVFPDQSAERLPIWITNVGQAREAADAAGAAATRPTTRPVR